MRFRLVLLMAAAALGGCAANRFAMPNSGLHAETFGVAKRSAVKTLIVVLHGDGTPDQRADQYGFAQKAAQTIPDSAALAILRPGYADAEGNHSPGLRGQGVGDNYTVDRLRRIGDTIAAAKAQLPNARVILVGDNGGAAIAADLAGIRHGLLDGIVLVSCPCSLPEWRRYRDKRAGSDTKETAEESLDPLKTAGGVSADLRAVILVGAEDQSEPARFSQPYAEALALRGITTDYRIVQGTTSLRLDNPQVLDATERLAASLPEKR